MGELEPRLSSSVEDYVKAIYEIQQHNSVVSTNDLAAQLAISPAAASKMMKHLASLNLVSREPYEGVRLTPSGEKVALEILRHRRLLELYLHKALGYEWDELSAEVERLEHVLSEEMEERIAQFLGDPLTDPHGDPIPTRDGVIAPLRGEPLSNAEAGDTLIILRVSDSDTEALRYLRKLEMRLGVTLEVVEKQPFNGPLTLRIGERLQSIGRELAGRVFVEPCSTKLETEVLV